jgi:hypothetical protein
MTCILVMLIQVLIKNKWHLYIFLHYLSCWLTSILIFFLPLSVHRNATLFFLSSYKIPSYTTLFIYVSCLSDGLWVVYMCLLCVVYCATLSLKKNPRCAPVLWCWQPVRHVRVLIMWDVAQRTPQLVQNLWLYAISAYAGELCKDNTSWCSGDVGFTLLDISLAFYWYYIFPECNRSAIGVSLSCYYFPKYVFLLFNHLHASIPTYYFSMFHPGLNWKST